MALGRAVAQLGNAGRVGVVDQQHLAPEHVAEHLLAGQSIQALSMFAAVRTTPCWTTPGMVTPTGASLGSSSKCSAISPTTSATASGVECLGVRIL